MKRSTNTILTNMCMVCDGENILVQDKINSSYTGVTFPGGHVENGESLTDAMIREVFEETGLSIKHPQLCGIYNWICNEGTRYFVFLYKATEFFGKLQSSEEGQVRWIKKDTFLNEKLAQGMDKVFEIISNEEYTECYYDDGVEHLRQKHMFLLVKFGFRREKNVFDKQEG